MRQTSHFYRPENWVPGKQPADTRELGQTTAPSSASLSQHGQRGSKDRQCAHTEDGNPELGETTFWGSRA